MDAKVHLQLRGKLAKSLQLRKLLPPAQLAGILHVNPMRFDVSDDSLVMLIPPDVCDMRIRRILCNSPQHGRIAP